MPKKTNKKETTSTTVKTTVVKAQSVEGPANEGPTEKEIAEIKEAFELFDKDKSGEVDIEELKSALRNLEIDPENKALKNMLEEIDENKSGTLEFNEFLRMLTQKMGDGNSREELQVVFDGFLGDSPEDKVTFEDLKKICSEVGSELTDDDLKEMILRADMDRDGKVSFDEFFDIMNKYSK